MAAKDFELKEKIEIFNAIELANRKGMLWEFCKENLDGYAESVDFKEILKWYLSEINRNAYK